MAATSTTVTAGDNTQPACAFPRAGIACADMYSSTGSFDLAAGIEYVLRVVLATGDHWVVRRRYNAFHDMHARRSIKSGLAGGLGRFHQRWVTVRPVHDGRAGGTSCGECQ